MDEAASVMYPEPFIKDNSAKIMSISSPASPDIHMTLHDRVLTICFNGPLDKSALNTTLQALNKSPLPGQAHIIHVNMRHVTRMDDFGTVILMYLARLGKQPPIFEEVPDTVRPFVDAAKKEDGWSARPVHEKPGWVEKLGGATLDILNDLQGMLTFVGDVVLSLGLFLRKPSCLRTGDTLIHMQRVGADALPIVALISFLLGLIMAFMSAVQLEQFGANIYVASLVSLSMVRELGPIMTAIIVAGRSGSAFAAEIGSMRVAEEIDALTTMGFDITVFLVLPRLLATLLVQPILTLFSDLFAVMGGLVVGVTMLNLTTHGYMAQTIKTIDLNDMAWSMLKTMLFAILIAGTGCLRGFQVRGGADAVGRATTSSVVTSLFLIILTDSILAVIQRYWG